MRDFGAIDGRPQSGDVHRSVDIRVGGIAAGIARKPMFYPNPKTAALRTCLARVGWIDEAQCYSGFGGLVVYESSQLKEGPTINHRACLASLDAITNAGQVFEHECAVVGLGVIDQPTADAVIGIPHELVEQFHIKQGQKIKIFPIANEGLIIKKLK